MQPEVDTPVQSMAKRIDRSHCSPCFSPGPQPHTDQAGYPALTLMAAEKYYHAIQIHNDHPCWIDPLSGQNGKAAGCPLHDALQDTGPSPLSVDRETTRPLRSDCRLDHLFDEVEDASMHKAVDHTGMYPNCHAHTR